MTRALLLGLVLVAVGCDGDGAEDPVDGSASSDERCGAAICAANEYCVSTCSGGDASEECRPFTRSCDASNMCACSEIAELGGICDQARRRVDVPCS